MIFLLLYELIFHFPATMESTGNLNGTQGKFYYLSVWLHERIIQAILLLAIQRKDHCQEQQIYS